MKNKMHRLLLFFVIFVSAQLFAQSDGTTVYNFLNISYSVRSIGLEGNLGLYGGDVGVQLDNPAALAEMDTTQISASYNNQILDFFSGYLGYLFPKTKLGTFAAGLVYFDYGSFNETDEFGRQTGAEFSAFEMALFLSYAKFLDDNFAIGANLKLINSSLANRSSQGYALDLAFNWKPDFLNDGRVLLIAKNIGSQLSTYYDDREMIPYSIQVGVSHKPEYLPIIVGLLLKDLNYRSENFTDRLKRFVISAEFRSKKILSIRLGYDNKKREDLSKGGSSGFGGVSLGFGINIKSFRFDYAISLLNDLGNGHNFGIIWNL